MRRLASPSRKRPSFFSRFKSLIQLSLVASLLLACSGLMLLGSSRPLQASAHTNQLSTEQAQTAKAHFSSAVSIQAARRGNPWINLSDGQDLITSYSAPDSAASFNQAQALPLSLVAADFDEDGIADLVSGYELPSGGTVTLLRGNIDSIYPNTPEAQQRRREGNSTETPFLAPAMVFGLPEKPDFIEAGDFNADGHWDLITAARGSNQLYFLAGNGRASFDAPRALAVNGQITALKCGEVNRADGLTDLVVGTVNADGARLVVFESPQGAINGKPESFDLPAPAADLGIDYLDNDDYGDIAVATGHELLIVSGRDRKLTLPEAEQASVAAARISHQMFPVELRALAIGDFAGDLGLEIAVLGADGAVQLLQQGARQQTQSAKSSAAWQIKPLSAMGSTTASRLLRVRVSSLSHENLLIIDPAGKQVRIWMNEEERRERGDISVLSSSGQSLPTILNVEDEPLAVYPMRLNRDALSDLVVLRKGNASPAVVTTQAVNDFCVTTKNDCTGCGSLRDAIANANSSPGMDEISFNDAFSGSTQTITLSSPLPSLTEAVVLDGTSNCGSQTINKVRVDGGNNLSRAVNLPSGGSVVRGLVVTRFNNGMQLSQSTGNIIEGNFIGVDAGGNNARGNGRGVMVNNAANNTIGGTASPSTNIISGNTTGIEISGNNATGNLVRLNLIGVTNNNTAIGNDQNGIDILSGAARNTIGGTTPQAGNVLNVIAGNLDGVSIQSATSNLVQSCLFDLNRHNGITVTAQGNTLGGASNALINAIWRSKASGVELNGNLATDNLVQGNYVGVNFAANGSVIDMANSGHGILITNNSSRNAIGGVTKSTGNLIALNHGNGITVVSGTQNQIFSNRIAANTLLGIDLGNDGPTANDDKDGDSGPNDLQNFPVLNAAVVTGTAGADEVSALAQSVTITVSFNSTPNQSFFLQFFIGGGNCDCKTSSCLGSLPLPLSDPVQVMTGPDGNFSSNFTFAMPADASSTGFVNATATTLNGSTSELSQCVALGTQVGCAPICPANQTKDAGSASSIQVTYPDAALPNGCPGVTVSCAPPSGSSFPVGVTTVTCTSKDAASTRGTCSFTVTVTGPPGPVITNVVKEGKSFVLTGTGFAAGAKVMVNGVDKKTRVDSPTSIFSKKGAKAASLPASIQVRAADGSLSNVFTFN